MRKLISNTGGWLSTNFATDDLTDFVPLIILRDPIQRWVSNCPARGKILTISKDPLDLDRLFDNLESWLYDEHSAKQTDFIAGLDLSRAVYFYCDKDLSCNVEYFLQAQGINFTAPAPVNEQETDEITKQSAKIWQELLSRSKYHDRFREIFAEDYKLIESVKFYKHDN